MSGHRVNLCIEKTQRWMDVSNHDDKKNVFLAEHSFLLLE